MTGGISAPARPADADGVSVRGSAGAAVRPADAEGAGRAVERVLDRLEAEGGPAARAAGDELVRALMRFYGAGLARILDLLAAPAAEPLAALLADEQVAGLLTLHDLHPEDLRTRIERALAALSGRPFALAGLDEAAARVTLQRSGQSHGCGCGNTAESDREAAEAAISCFAPEIETVEVAPQAPAQAPLLQIGVRPGAAAGAPR